MLAAPVMRRRVVEVAPTKTSAYVAPERKEPPKAPLTGRRKTHRRRATRARQKERRERVAAFARSVGLTPTPRVALEQDGGIWFLVGCAEGDRGLEPYEASLASTVDAALLGAEAWVRAQGPGATLRITRKVRRGRPHRAEGA